ETAVGVLLGRQQRGRIALVDDPRRWPVGAPRRRQPRDDLSGRFLSTSVQRGLSKVAQEPEVEERATRGDLAAQVQKDPPCSTPLLGRGQRKRVGQLRQQPRLPFL